jgi:DNA-binding MarR family transcriptional regulator
MHKTEMSQRCVCATLRKASRAVSQMFDAALRPSGLRATQFHILAEVGGAGETTITQLTKRMVMDQTTLTRSIAILERNGLVKAVAKADARMKPLQLTAKGQKALGRAQPLWAEAQARMVKMIGSDSWKVLGAELERMANAEG